MLSIMMNIDGKLFQDIFERYYRDENFSGVGLVRLGNKNLFLNAYGFAHKGWQIQNQISTRFDTASITKLFTAVAVLKLIDQGSLSLTDTAVAVLGLENTKISDKVNVYHLLTHTSGIGDDADEEAGESYEALWKDKPNYSVRETIDFLPQFINKEPNFEPGQGCRYNNVAYILLGLIVERLTGMKYRDYMKENLFNKLGMSSTEFCSTDGVFSNVAEGYVKITAENSGRLIGWRKNIYSYPPVGSPDGGAYSTVEDLDRFIRELKNGKFLSAPLTRELFTPKEVYRERDDDIRMTGYGFQFTTKHNGEIISIHKDGVNPGVACILSYYPKQDLTLAILANQDCNVWNMRKEIHSLILKEML